MTKPPESLLVFAASHYLNRGSSTAEFMEDYKRVANVTRLINRFNNGAIKFNIRMVLNQIVVLSNSFGVEATTEMLLTKVDGSGLGILYPMLVFLGYMNEEQLSRESVEFNRDIVNSLRELVRC